MIALTPTVHERLSRCGQSVHVDGLAGGLTELFVLGTDGTRSRYQVEGTSGAYEFAVAPLAAADTVFAKQTVGAEMTPESPPVVVEDVHLPVDTAPRLPETVDPCAHCLGVDGIVPGADVELSVGGATVGSGTAGRDGSLCIGLAAPPTGESWEGEELSARMIVCGEGGPSRRAPFIRPRQGEITMPPYIGLMFDCQSSVPLRNLTPGAEVSVESNLGETLGGFDSCWTAVNLWGIRQLHHRWPDPARAPDRLRPRQHWRSGTGCGRPDTIGPYTEVAPLTDELLRPIVRESLIDGDRILRVEGQVAGANLMIHVARGGATVDYGPRPAGDSQEIALNEALRARDVVSVTQELCSRRATSLPVTVQARPTILAAPVIIAPLWECGAAVRVSNLAAGALVRVYQEGFAIGVAWSGMEPSITVVVRPSLRAEASVTAVQVLGGQRSPASAEVIPGRLGEAPAPRLLEPIAAGESEVWVSHVAPGSIVTVRSGPRVIGEIAAAESIVRVPVTFVDPMDTLSTSARLCGTSVLGSNTVQPIRDPGAPGDFDSWPRRQRPKTYSVRLELPAEETHDSGDTLVTPLQGLWYEPAHMSDDLLAQLPLVVIAHGYWAVESDPDFSNWSRSFRGYGYLAEHLVSWGMRVFSLDMTDVNAATNNSTLRQGGRAALILRAIDAIANDEYRPSQRGNSPMRIALIGHSMAGEAVVIARNRGFRREIFRDVSGVVAIAPVFYETTEVPEAGAYLQLIGSHDILVRNIERFPMFQAYDRGARVKTHYWIQRARHNGFNRSWLANNDNEVSARAVSLDPETAGNSVLVEREADLIVARTHERLAKALITPFLVKTFDLPARYGAAAYARYLTGTILPPSIRDVTVHTQHAGGSIANTTVVDNFGESDELAGVSSEAPINRGQNTMGLESRAEGPGLRSWDDVLHTSLRPHVNTPHSTVSTRIQWADGLTEYRTKLSLMRPPASDSVLSIRVGQAGGTGVTLNPQARPLDLFVALRDVTGVEAVVRLGAIAPAPFSDIDLCPMRTVRIPIDAFTAVAPALALDSLESVIFRFTARATGDVFIDDVEFTVY